MTATAMHLMSPKRLSVSTPNKRANLLLAPTRFLSTGSACCFQGTHRFFECFLAMLHLCCWTTLTSTSIRNRQGSSQNNPASSTANCWTVWWCNEKQYASSSGIWLIVCMISYNSLSTTDCNIRYGVAILQTRTTSSREKATTTTYEQLGFSIQ